MGTVPLIYLENVMKTARPAFTKSDLFQLKASLIVIYMVQRAVFNDAERDNETGWYLNQEVKQVAETTTNKIKKLFARARKMGIPNKTIYALDNIAHRVAFNWYS
jgi:hypothetical protein